MYVAAAIGVIGCGGLGGNNTGTNAGGTNATASAGAGSRINLDNQGSGAFAGAGTYVVDYMTGQGRAQNDLTAIVRREFITDDLGTEETTLLSPISLLLKGFQHQAARLDIKPLARDSRLFQAFNLDFIDFEVDNGSAQPSHLAPPSNLPFAVPARIRIFPGRTTSIPIFVDDSMFDASSGSVVFNSDQFNAVNLGTGTEIKSFLSDYVAFDISSLPLAARPLLTNGDPAGRIYFSGDAFALSEGGQYDSNGNVFSPPRDERGLFEVLTQDVNAPIDGHFAPSQIITGTPTPGTYSLVTPDPTDLTGIARITALQGTWYDFTKVLVSTQTFELITLPSSNDDKDDDVVAIVKTGNKITALYYGFADLEAGTFDIFPVASIVNGTDTSGELTGSLTGMVTGNNVTTTVVHQMRSGTFTFTGGSRPASIPNTGRFLVYRR